MQTGTQDIRLPVQAVSPYTGELIDLATARHGRGKFTYLCPKTGKEFDVLGSMPDVPAAKLVSERFEVGQHFCNKLWNAARFALMNLQDVTFEPREIGELADEDRWILSRLSKAVAAVQRALEEYNPSAAIGAARDFFWSELCDWYLELIKPRMRAEATTRGSDEATQGAVARLVLAFAIDQVLRLFHPFVPFITEAIWERLNAQVPVRGIEKPLRSPALVIHAPWPIAQPAWQDDALEAQFDLLRDVIRGIRDIRNKYNVPPGRRVPVRIRASGPSARSLARMDRLIAHMAMLDSLEVSPQVVRPADAATAVVRDAEVYVCGVVDVGQERARLTKQREQLVAQIAATEKKLSNESFVGRAKPEVVDRERIKLAHLRTQLTGVEANLKALG